MLASWSTRCWPTDASRPRRADLLRALDVRIGSPIFGVDLEAARERLAALPWVESVTIERRLPDMLYVRIVEAEPMALWQHEGKLRLLSRNGEPIDEPQPLRFASLPLVVGAGAPEHAAELLAMLATQPELQVQVKAAVRVGERRWNLQLRQRHRREAAGRARRRSLDRAGAA